MWFKRSKETRERNKEQSEMIDRLHMQIIDYSYKLEQLEKENKKLIEYFVKNYHYVLTVDKNLYIHLYQDGQEIKHINNIDFEAAIDSVPTFNIEVH